MKIDNSVINLIRKSKYDDSPGGVDCYFVKLSDKWGIKIYCDPDRRDYCYNRQLELSKFDLAPMVGDKFDINDISDPKFCMVTEVAELHENAMTYPSWKWNDTYEKLQDKITRLNKKIQKKTGKRTFDLHLDNIGWIVRNGKRKLVAIDVGDG